MMLHTCSSVSLFWAQPKTGSRYLHGILISCVRCLTGCMVPGGRHKGCAAAQQWVPRGWVNKRSWVLHIVAFLFLAFVFVVFLLCMSRQDWKPAWCICVGVIFAFPVKAWVQSNTDFPIWHLLMPQDFGGSEFARFWLSEVPEDCG